MPRANSIRSSASAAGRTDTGEAGAEASGNGNASDAIGKQGRFETRPAELLYPLTRLNGGNHVKKPFSTHTVFAALLLAAPLAGAADYPPDFQPSVIYRDPSR